MTNREEQIFQYILYSMAYIKEASVLYNKLPESDIKSLLEEYLYSVGDLTHNLGLNILKIKTDVSDSDFETMMKKLMRKKK